MTTTVDLGDGQTVMRKHLPKEMLREFDEATATFRSAQDFVRSWVKTLVAMQAPADFSGVVQCTAVGLSGRTYTVPEVGGALLIDQRDTTTFTGLGFAGVPEQQPTDNLRVGLVFYDTAAKSYMRFDGTSWSAVTLS